MSDGVSVTRSGGGTVAVDRTQGAVKVVTARDIGSLTAAAQDAVGEARAEAAAAAASAAAAGAAVQDVLDGVADGIAAAVGATVEAWDATLDAIAALNPTTDQGLYFTGANVAATFGLTAFARTLVDDADAAAMRATLGLGTAALVDTGTSGATVPLLNAPATFSGGTWSFNVADTTPVVTLQSTDAGAGASPLLRLFRNSASPAANDFLGGIQVYARNSTPASVQVASLTSQLLDATAGSEDARFRFDTAVAGTLAGRVYIGDGMYSIGVSGGDKGADTLNFTTLYEAGTLLSSKYAAISGTSMITVTSASLGTLLLLTSTEPGSGSSPDLVLWRNSASPAASDAMGRLIFRGMDSGGNQTAYAVLESSILDPTDTSEDSQLRILMQVAGSQVSAFSVANGALVGAGTSGGFQGTGTLNAATLYENGTALTSKYMPVASYPTLVSLEGLSLASGDVLYATAADTLARLAKGADGQVLGLAGGIPTYLSTREVLTGARTYFVATTGSDSNNGLTVGAPFATIGKALAVAAALDCSTFSVTIQVADGTYTAQNVLPTMIGSGTFTILGNTTTPSNCVVSVTSGSCFFTSSNCYTNWVLNGFKVQTTTSGNGIFNQGCCNISFSNFNFGSCAGAHITARYKWSGVSPGTNYTISGGATIHISNDLGGYGFYSGRTITFTANCTFSVAFVYCIYHGILSMSGMTFTLGGFSVTGPRFLLGPGGVIDTGGGGASYLPGSTAGSGTNFGSSPWGLYQ